MTFNIFSYVLFHQSALWYIFIYGKAINILHSGAHLGTQQFLIHFMSHHIERGHAEDANVKCLRERCGISNDIAHCITMES